MADFNEVMQRDVLAMLKSAETRDEKVNRQVSRIDALEARLNSPDAVREHKAGSPNGWKTAGERMAADWPDIMKGLNTNQRYRYQVGQMFAPSIEGKSTVGSSDVGFATPGVISAQRVSGIVPGARRRLTIRDLLVSKPITTSLIDWPKESSFTSNASPQTELSAKAESTFALTIASSRVSTIAHFVNTSRQLLDDVVGVREYIDTALLWYLRLKEEQELLSGDGLLQHQSGLITNAQSFAGTYAVAGDTIIDKLFHMQTEAAIRDEVVNFYVLNPIDWARVNLVKTDQSGANTGVYLVGERSR